MNKPLLDCADIALTKCLGLKRNEQLLVVCDDPCFTIGEALWQAGRALCREAVMVVMAPRRQNGNEPPPEIGELFKKFDVAVMPTSKSLSHTQARRTACAAGTRIATLPGITEETFLRTMDADWERLGVYTRKIAGRLKGAKKVRVVSEAGCDLAFEITGRPLKIDDGRITGRGAFGNLPAGEIYCAPLEGTAEGTIAFDGSFAIGGICEKPILLTVKKGRVVAVADHVVKPELDETFKTYRPSSRTIAEFGIGAHPAARITGSILEDEKVRGTIHFALGDNASMGGAVRVPVHLDGIVKNPDVWADGELLLDKVELVK
ncbi:MAG: aminopeptidase [Chitinivibrionales bacterium]|nr:aminopeptidase [Chitinivibrionales bacterium]